MTVINRYLAREIIKFFAIVLAAVASIYLAVDFFEKIDDFVLKGAPLDRTIAFFLLRLPLFCSQTTPVCILLSVLISFGLMNKNNEIIALKCSGVSIYYLLRPVLVIGIVFSAFLFLLSEVVVPITTAEANKIHLLEVRKKSLVTARKNIWIKGDRAIYYITHYNPQKNTISGISMNYFDNDFRLIKRIDAEKGAFKKGNWVLFNVMEQVLNKEAGSYEVSFYENGIAQVDFLPQDLKRVVKKSEEMNIKELYSYIQSIESEGYDATVYRVDFHAKFAIPAICFIMCIIGTGIALKRRVKEGISISIAYGVGLVFIYWVSFSFFMSLGYGGMLPPIIAVWISNFIFLCLGLFYLINAE